MNENSISQPRRWLNVAAIMAQFLTATNTIATHGPNSFRGVVTRLECGLPLIFLFRDMSQPPKVLAPYEHAQQNVHRHRIRWTTGRVGEGLSSEDKCAKRGTLVNIS